jgi:hypothetical protein
LALDSPAGSFDATTLVDDAVYRPPARGQQDGDLDDIDTFAGALQSSHNCRLLLLLERRGVVCVPNFSQTFVLFGRDVVLPCHADIMIAILSLLEYEDLLTAACVSKHVHVFSSLPVLWLALFLRDFDHRPLTPARFAHCHDYKALYRSRLKRRHQRLMAATREKAMVGTVCLCLIVCGGGCDCGCIRDSILMRVCFATPRPPLRPSLNCSCCRPASMLLGSWTCAPSGCRVYVYFPASWRHWCCWDSEWTVNRSARRGWSSGRSLPIWAFFFPPSCCPRLFGFASGGDDHPASMFTPGSPT